MAHHPPLGKFCRRACVVCHHWPELVYEHLYEIVCVRVHWDGCRTIFFPFVRRYKHHLLSLLVVPLGFLKHLRVAFSKGPGWVPTALVRVVISMSCAAQYWAMDRSSGVSAASAAINACLPSVAGFEFMIWSTCLLVSRESNSSRYLSHFSEEVSLVINRLHPFRSLAKSEKMFLISLSIGGRRGWLPYLLTYSRNF